MAKVRCGGWRATLPTPIPNISDKDTSETCEDRPETDPGIDETQQSEDTDNAVE